MATPRNIVENEANTVADTPEVFYTDDGTDNGTTIDAFTASNSGSSNGSYKAYIVGLGDSPVNPIIPFEIVTFGENELGVGIVNQLIPPGGTLQMESSAIDKIFFTVSGRKV